MAEPRKKTKPATDAGTRRTQSPLRVYANKEERDAIKARAAAAGMTLSSYLLHVGMGYPIRSILDHERVSELAKVNGDLGRLGGLLKMWLSQDDRLSFKNFPHVDRTIVAALNKIEANQGLLREIMEAIVHP